MPRASKCPGRTASIATKGLSRAASSSCPSARSGTSRRCCREAPGSPWQRVRPVVPPSPAPRIREPPYTRPGLSRTHRGFADRRRSCRPQTAPGRVGRSSRPCGPGGRLLRHSPPRARPECLPRVAETARPKRSDVCLPVPRCPGTHRVATTRGRRRGRPTPRTQHPLSVRTATRRCRVRWPPSAAIRAARVGRAFSGRPKRAGVQLRCRTQPAVMHLPEAGSRHVHAWLPGLSSRLGREPPSGRPRAGTGWRSPLPQGAGEEPPRMPRQGQGRRSRQ